ncbi:MAG: hypothetical protein JWO35_338 [Candidatus Saccharibacteria bacterium]|nr:hypothetical protein [Candidatus Saccharibacteria bacterium]
MTKVMLVEDDNNLREIYEARLQAEGYDIVAAKDGEEALVLAKQHQPELVISDVMMPKISGFEMLDILRNTDGLKDVKVIMLTALGQSDDQARADKLGADRYLVKSQVTLEDIVTVAKELIDGEAAPAATPAAAPEPVAAAPAVPAPPAEPVAEPVAAEPVAVAPEPTAAPATDSTDDPAAQSTAQEEAAIEAKIEDFVAGASGQQAVPAPEASAEEPDAVVFETVTSPTPEVAVEPTPAPQTAAEVVTASDDKLMSDAVDALVANTEGTTPPAVPEAAPVAKAPADSGSVAINGKKVISPVSSGQAKPDLQALLAKEEAKDIAAGTTVTPTTPAAPATPPTTPGGIDPNSIAL